MLKGKCAVITGASRGIGKCIATKFAKEGANVVINYRNNEEEALKVKKELEDLGSQVLVVKADVSELEQAENLIKEAKKEFGRVDILVNNAVFCDETEDYRTPAEPETRMSRFQTGFSGYQGKYPSTVEKTAARWLIARHFQPPKP